MSISATVSEKIGGASYNSHGIEARFCDRGGARRQEPSS